MIAATVKSGLTIGAIAALDDIACERSRQMTREGHTLRQDDRYVGGELARAAGCYALALYKKNVAGPYWPWSLAWWKPKRTRHNLVRAGALIVAELERLDRLAQQGVHHG